MADDEVIENGANRHADDISGRPIDREQRKGEEQCQDKDVFDSYEFGGQEEGEDQVTSKGSEDSSVSVSQKKLAHLAGKWVDGENVCTASIDTPRRYVCVEFPCVVKDTAKAVKMLGGKEEVEKTLSKEGRRFELNFRPHDPFCKPAVSNDKNVWGLVIKVRRRKKKKVPEPVEAVIAPGLGAGAANSEADASSMTRGAMKPSTSSPPEASVSHVYEYQLEVLGVVDTLYSFDNQCDFQFLPVSRTDAGDNEEILSKIIPSIDVDREDYLARQCPLFLPPTMFSRRERPCFYALENDPVSLETNTQPNSLRKRREHGSHIINFEEDVLPTEPLDIAVRNVKRYLPNYLNTDIYSSLTELFNTRPVWSRTACMAHLDPSHDLHLKYLLPMLSYCFITGPWRNLWCRFGYDPRKHKEAKIYQIVDYRVRSAFNRNKVVRKRQKETARAYPSASSRSYDASIELGAASLVEDAKGRDNFDPKYMFHPDIVPPYRQMRYQLCDIYEEEVQRKVHENDGMEDTCTERDGWCVANISDVCRDILNSHVERLLGT